MESGEYWIIHSRNAGFAIYSLNDGNYVPSRLFTSGDVVKSKCNQGFKLDLEAFFGRYRIVLKNHCITR